MDSNKYTQKTVETLKAAQSLAEENQNQYITPEHLLFALLDQEGGLIPSLFGKLGADNDAILSELRGEINKLPKVSGANDQIYISRETEKVLRAAEKAGDAMHDEYLSVEHLMLGIFAAPTSAIRSALAIIRRLPADAMRPLTGSFCGRTAAACC